jgi:GTP-binding protein
MPAPPALKAEYIISSRDISGCPAPDKPEYAFLGRSNVGKSSLINMITGQKAVARTSAKPGKTRLINHFLIEGQWYLVDLPGFGYAKTPRTIRKEWEKIIQKYLMFRNNLMCNFFLVDARLKMQNIDRLWINYHGENGLPLALVFTKTDKLSNAVLSRNLEEYKDQLLKEWEVLPPIFLTSSINGRGREELLEFITKTNKIFQDPD